MTVYFGDDWGNSVVCKIGTGLWRQFIYRFLKRMYSVVRDSGKLVFIHSCGDVDELS